MTDHTHCWHARPHTPPLPATDQCCWCGQRLYKAPSGATEAHGPYATADTPQVPMYRAPMHTNRNTVKDAR